MNKKQKKNRIQIFKTPSASNIQWKEIESLFESLGCEISEGSGSRIRVKLNGVRAVFHSPHPDLNTDKGAVNSVRKFLLNAGVKL
jgi:hypothetical protein